MAFGKILSRKILNSRYLLLALWCSVIFAGSSLPGASVSKNPLIDFILHKGAHLFEYGILFVFSYKAFRKKGALSFLFVFFYALSDEFHQRFVPGRNGRIEDVSVDLIGALLGAVFIWKFLRILPAKLKNWLLT
ncbi:hypothetical protein AUJ94_01080 [bacterium CG2_30_40_12]|uniref:VanZ-like domain-containing protein n=1 Tax=candidate division WWE3 bacterium CG23_combo_of_CG06-09_8_20_14_all_40_14 TaxID=1975095 RepID=A0A2G9XBM6_UNCKA|nr:MAG: hypothetical protein AUJ94_01080 [bacterium CG2_30_40_12]PIP04388.1 MAG: hypothetical protein COX53_02710 [candidate division WWE3 bacterium CG23_combo_of_CG06-09_8_20_14_all_40_14]PJE51503.1 MAG: hypothetical protein COV27_02035 [candidate division WWE3 bacterium CG10_big_fil_rev_8_21_14_0_10_39_14]